jgi:hypothetical protein
MQARLGTSILVAMTPSLRHRRARQRACKLVLVCLSLALAGCESPIRVATDFDPEIDFSEFETYAWISAEPLIPQISGVTNRPPISPIDDRRIRAAVATQLGEKGWREIQDPEEADLIVSYGIGAKEHTEVYETPNVGGYYGRGYRYGGWYAGSTVRTKQVTEGTLTLEFFDRRTGQAAWVGWASKRLSGYGQDRSKTVDTAIQKILNDFPSRL